MMAGYWTGAVVGHNLSEDIALSYLAEKNTPTQGAGTLPTQQAPVQVLDLGLK